MKILNIIVKLVKAIIVPITTKIAIYATTYYALPLMITTIGPIPTIAAAATYIMIGPEIVNYMII